MVELGGNFRVGENQFSYVVSSKPIDQRGAISLTGPQLVAISEALAKVKLDPSRMHHADISILSEGKFRVVIDKKTVVVVKAGATSEDMVVLQEKTRSSLASSIKEMFKAVTNLFYKPAFPNPVLKE